MKISDIIIPTRRRQLRDTTNLAASIGRIGLLEDIAVTDQGVLVFGRHRLEACKSLGWVDIPAKVLTLSALDTELAEIDENLERNELDVLERSEHLKRRKEIYEAKHPQAKHGGAPAKTGKGAGRGKATKDPDIGSLVESAPSFVDATAEKTKKSKSTIAAEVQIATNLTEETKEAIRNTPTAKSKTELSTLAKMTPAEQAEAVKKVKTKKAKTYKQAAYQKKEETALKQVVEDAQRPEISHLDAVSFLRTIPDKSVDLLLTDPPYSTDVDDLDGFILSWLNLAISKVRPSGRAYICIGAYPDELHAYLAVLLAQSEMKLANVLVWTYRNTLGPTPKLDYKQNWQAILYLRGPDAEALDCPIMNEQFSVQDISAPDGRQGNREHPWQKPDALAERLIRHSTKPGDLILDPFAGTGTFLLSAVKLGRQAKGCDNGDTSLKIAIERGCVHAG